MSEPRAFSSGGNLGRKLCTFHPQDPWRANDGVVFLHENVPRTQMGPLVLIEVGALLWRVDL